MKSTILLTLYAVSLSAQSTFEVKEIPPSAVQKLTAAEAKLEDATKALATAQKAVEDAKTARAKAEAEAISAANEQPSFEGDCNATGTLHDMGASMPYGYAKVFRRVEIRGKYVLISAGSESCGLSTYIMLNNGATLGGTTK